MLIKPKKLILAMTLCLGFSGISYASENPWLFRLRGIVVVPSVSSSTINVIGGNVTDISTAVVPEFDISYFFTPHIAAELILGTTRHTVKATGTAVGNPDLGSVFLLPPTLTAQYHFLPNAIINPYLGVGLNYTYFYNVKNGPGLSGKSYTNSFGPAFQAGVDIALNKHWSINLDVKKILIRTTATLNAAGVPLTSDVKIDPFVYGIGVGYHF